LSKLLSNFEETVPRAVSEAKIQSHLFSRFTFDNPPYLVCGVKNCEGYIMGLKHVQLVGDDGDLQPTIQKLFGTYDPRSKADTGRDPSSNIIKGALHLEYLPLATSSNRILHRQKFDRSEALFQISTECLKFVETHLEDVCDFVQNNPKKEVQWLTCPNGHFVGVTVHNDAFILPDSPVSIFFSGDAQWEELLQVSKGCERLCIEKLTRTRVPLSRYSPEQIHPLLQEVMLKQEQFEKKRKNMTYNCKVCRREFPDKINHSRSCESGYQQLLNHLETLLHREAVAFFELSNASHFKA